jgi:hypothetical protein
VSGQCGPLVPNHHNSRISHAAGKGVRPSQTMTATPAGRLSLTRAHRQHSPPAMSIQCRAPRRREKTLLIYECLAYTTIYQLYTHNEASYALIPHECASRRILPQPSLARPLLPSLPTLVFVSCATQPSSPLDTVCLKATVDSRLQRPPAWDKSSQSGSRHRKMAKVQGPCPHHQMTGLTRESSDLQRILLHSPRASVS